MYEYFFEQMEASKGQQVDSSGSQTLLLVTSRTKQAQNQQREHLQMLAQDIQTAVYHQLNAIVQLEQLEQLQTIEEPKVTIKQDMANSQIWFSSAMNQTAQTFSSYQCKVQQQVEITRKKAQIDIEINRLKIDKNTLIEQIGLLGQQWKEYQKSLFQNKTCKKAEEKLIEHGRRYNLCKVVGQFMEDMKQNLVRTWLVDTFQNVSRINICLDDLRLGLGQFKSKKQLINNFTLYLQTFYSSNVVKQLSQVIERLVNNYESCRRDDDKRMINQIEKNLENFDKIVKMIADRNSKIMDFKIDMQILAEEIKNKEKQLSFLQQDVEESIHKEAQILAGQYARANRIDQNHMKFFQEQLASQYRNFISSHAQRAQQIDRTSRKIQYYSTRIQECQQQIKILQKDQNFVKQNQEYSVKTSNASSPVLKESKRNNYTSRQKSRNFPAERRRKDSQKERFIARKIFNIGSAQKRKVHKAKSQNSKECQVKLTSKYLILQPIGNQALTVCQKIELEHIKNYQFHKQKGWLKIDYGGCILNLHFMTLNIASFERKIKALLGPKIQHN